MTIVLKAVDERALRWIDGHISDADYFAAARARAREEARAITAARLARRAAARGAARDSAA